MAWLNRYIIKLDLDLLLDAKNLWLDIRAADSEYNKEISSVRYDIESYLIIRPNTRPEM